MKISIAGSRPTRRFHISHTKFLIAFPAALYAICNALNIEKLAKWFRDKDGLDLLGLSAYLFAGLCVFIAVFALLAHRRTIKPLAILLTVVSAAATYFIAKYNVAVDSSMVLNTIHTDTTEVGQLLSWQMLPYVLFLIVVPVVAILSIDITFKASGKYLFASAGLIGATLCIALACLYANYNAIHRAGNVSNKYIVYSLVPINIISSTVSVVSKSLRPWLRGKPPEISASVTSRDNLVVVLAIGESSRRKNFSVYGYDRADTTPVLRKTEGLSLLNGIATRGSTLYALRQILEKDDVKLTAIVAKAGVPTSCYVNYTLYDNCLSPGETMVSKCGHDGKCFDEDVIPLLDENLKSYVSGPRFVVLHMGGGSHGPVYANRHPPEFLRFKPLCNDADVANKCTLDQLFNSYDNTILYVDHVVGEAIQSLDRSGVPYVFIYLSDHGESLMENGFLFHGMPPGMALPDEQAQIPLIVKASVPVTVAKRDEYSQPDVFDTVLDLLSVQSPGFEKAGSFVRKRAEPAMHP